MGALADGLELTIRALLDGNRLGDEHAGLMATARGLAVAVESDAGNAALWREFRAVQASLMEAERGADDDDSQEFLAAVRAPLGDAADAGKGKSRPRNRGDRPAPGEASDAVAKGGRPRRR